MVIKQLDREDEWTERDRETYNGSGVDVAEPDRGSVLAFLAFDVLYICLFPTDTKRRKTDAILTTKVSIKAANLDF